VIDGVAVFALVPARGGSKGVPRKNIRCVAGRPLVAWTLSAACSVDEIDRVILSSDDDDILSIGQGMGITTLRRPGVIASDTASAVDVVLHYFGTLSEEELQNDPYIIYLQPTSPLRSQAHIAEAIAQMRRHDAESLMSVVRMEKSPFKSFLVDEEGKLKSLFDEKLSNARRQDLPDVFLPNGAIYIFRVSEFLRRGGFPSNGSFPYFMQEKDSVDVDSEEDLKKIDDLLRIEHG
jgi:CMP-N,N'-diacetyllegionaminic acid synthase